MSGILRGTFVIAALLMVAWVGGQLMLASHVETETRYLVAAVAAIVIVVAGFARAGGQRG